MRTPRRPLTLAAFALAATTALTLTALTLTACHTTVHANVDTAGITQDVAPAADTGSHHTSPRTPTTSPGSPSDDTSAGGTTDTGTTADDTTTDGTTDTGTTADDTSADDTSADDTSADSTSADDLPEPGYGVTGDEGLCQAEAGWYGYAGLALVGAAADDQVWPDEVVPVLEQLRDAPTAHEDASADLVAAASDLSYATDEVITEITAGADATQAMAELDDPFTTFADGCLAEGIHV
jgi:hypothetical protein